MLDGKTIKEQAALYKDWMIKNRRTIHLKPELGMEEFETCSFICQELDKLGIKYEKKGTAIIGLIEGTKTLEKPKKVVALRADIDALPVTEESGESFSSQNPGKMHACGHDAHTTILLGTGRWFSEHKNDFSGTVKLFFQPAEETVGGAEPMIKDGCMENPHVDYVLGLHVMPYMPVGQIETKKGALNGSSTGIKIKIKGLSGHAAYPERGIDAVMISSHVVCAIHSLVSRYVSPLESAVITIGSIHGGTVSNIIADEVEMKATLRSTSREIRDLLVDKIKSLATSISQSFGGSAEVDIHYGYAALINDSDCVDVVSSVANDILGPGKVNWKEKPSMGVEDFSFFCEKAKGAFFHLGCGNLEKNWTSPLHSSTFRLDEDCLPIGVAMEVASTLRLLEK